MELEHARDYPNVVRLSVLRKKWTYRGEGNANLVIALPEDRVILRLHKTPEGVAVTDDIACDEMNRVWRQAYFCHDVMVPLLGTAYITPPLVAQVPLDEIHRLNSLLTSKRPNFRRDKEIALGYVNIYPDYTLLPEMLSQKVPDDCELPIRSSPRSRVGRSPFYTLEDNSCSPLNGKSVDYSFSYHFKPQNEPTFCVEIKPKRGWLPHNGLDLRKCTFCLNQFLKLHKGAIDSLSQYCPLDLFSGNKKRMKKAICNLLHTPQNNLKIFKDGVLVFNEESSKQELESVLQQWFGPESHQSLTDSFCELVYQALTANLLGGDDYPSVDRSVLISPDQPDQGMRGWETDVAVKTGSCDLSSQPLPANCVLDRILWVQKLQLSNPKSTLRLLSKRNDRGSGERDCMATLVKPGSYSFSLDLIQRYLLATTANDCSILIAFRKLKNASDTEVISTEHITVDSLGQSRFVFNIGLSDLDPKPLSSIEKHQVRDDNIRIAATHYINKVYDQ